MTKLQLEAMVSHDDKLQKNLDELVCEVFAHMAADKNSEGPYEQVDWLEDQGMTVDQIASRIK